MAVAVLLAILGTLSTMCGLLLVSMGSYVARSEPQLRINGLFILIGIVSYALSAWRALGIARSRYRAGADALWPLTSSLLMAAMTLGIGSATGAQLFGAFVPGQHPWMEPIGAGLALGCATAAGTLVALRVIAHLVGAATAAVER